jgi:uncharacterized protein YyaL (SSP411 family)
MSEFKTPNVRSVNNLIREKSPYLIQHANNPVDWYPWCEEAFRKAIKEDRPIFLSIGYSTCHWCHVMAKESFEDKEIAELMNDFFVSIKVDREERPDIDSIYLKVCQLMNGSGGWPLNIIMTPDKKPFFATTYIPKESKFGRIGIKELISRIRTMWNDRRDELNSSAENIILSLKRKGIETETKSKDDLGKSTLDEAFVNLSSMFDELHGGFGTIPKFPTPHNLSFLLRYWRRTGISEALRIVEKTLEAMRLGGIYDHIGFGFHRYSTDRMWLVPHFEKMLYDQALLIIIYLEAYQVTKKKEYLEIVKDTIDYVLSDMTDPEGGFYSAENSESEGEEGKFYLWTKEEIEKSLSQKDAELAKKIFKIEKEGNFYDESTRRKTGKNIIHLEDTLHQIASKLNISLEDLNICRKRIRKKLFINRKKRIRPDKDDKILTDWNGLMIGSLAKSAYISSDDRIINAAKKAADFILTRMIDAEGYLYHRFREGDTAILGFLDDYAFFIWGLIELYQNTFEIRYLSKAIELTSIMMKHFWDNKNKGFFLTADNTESILIRDKPIYDGALPSGNSIAMLDLIFLSHITGNSRFEEKAKQIADTFSKNISESPSSYTQLLIALDLIIGPLYEIVIVGNMRYKDTKKMLDVFKKRFIPNKVILFKSTNKLSTNITSLAEFTRYMSSIGGKTTFYICKDSTCKLPVTNIQKALKIIDENI